MPNTILLKKSSTAAAQPTVGQLSPGELAINTADGRLFAKNAANAIINLPVTSISGQTITPGTVGINNTSPVSRLDVSHTITSNTAHAIAQFGAAGSGNWANSAHQVVIGGPSVSNYTGAIIYSDSTSGVGVLSFADGRGENDSWRGQIAYDHSADALALYANTVECMRINSAGKVGVGTADPQANFQVITGHDLTGYDESDPPLPIYAKTTSGLSGAQQSEVLQVIHGGYDYDTGAEEYFTNEYVNLARFHVNGAASRGSFSLSNSGSGAWENNVMQLFVHGANYPHAYYGGNESDAGCAMIVTQGSDIQKLQIGNYGAAPIEFFTSNTFRAAISTAGNFGIGTPTPGYKLDVVGDLNVSGAVRVNGQTILGNPISQSNYVTIGALATNQTITANADAAISFTDFSDPQGWWDPTTKRFQPTVAGNYNVMMQAWWDTGALTTGQTNVQCRKNGSTIMIAQDPINTVTGQTQTASRIIYFNGSSDYIDFTAYTGNTTSQTLLSGAANGQGTFFSASLIADGGLRLPGEMLYLWSNFR